VLDKVSGKLATSCTPELAKDTQTNGNAASWNVDLWAGGKPNTKTAAKTSGASGTAATDDVHGCSDSPPVVTVSVSGSPGSYTITVTASQGTHPLSGGTYTTAPAGTIAIQIAGQTICNLTIPAESSDVFSDSTCTYKPTAEQQAAVTALVVDSVLFSGTGSSDVTNFSPAVILSPLTFSNAHLSGSNKLTVSWTGGSGTVTVTRNGSPVCSASASDGQCTSSPNAAYNVGTHQVSLTDGTTTVSGSY
jgi:hypothetical protein